MNDADPEFQKESMYCFSDAFTMLANECPDAMSSIGYGFLPACFVCKCLYVRQRRGTGNHHPGERAVQSRFFFQFSLFFTYQL